MNFYDKKSYLYLYYNFAFRQIFFSLLLIIIGSIYKNIFLFLVGFFLLIFIIFFFRNTGLCLEKNMFVSPSSSKITKIKYINSNFLSKNIIINDYYNHNNKYIFIKTYLSPLDEHYIISPCDCVIFDIFDDTKKNDCERTSLLLKDKHNNIIKLEAAVSDLGHGSWIPNIIVNKRVIITAKKNKWIKKGDIIGMVRFGSEMAYYLPSKYKIIGNKGQHFRVGQNFATL